MCTAFRIYVVSAICVAVASGHVHGRRTRRMDAEDYAQNVIDSGRAEESSWWPSAEFSILQKVYDDCSSHKHVSMCLKGKALTALTRAVEQENVQLTDGLTLVKQADAPTAVAEPRFFPGMSTEDKLDTMLRTKFEQLMSTHTVNMDLASEGRGRGKKVLPYLLLGIFTTISIVGGMALKTLAAIAGKALIASKVALTIAGIIALKKLFSHDSAAGETTFQVHADGHHRRNLYVVRPAKKARWIHIRTAVSRRLRPRSWRPVGAARGGPTDDPPRSRSRPATVPLLTRRANTQKTSSQSTVLVGILLRRTVVHSRSQIYVSKLFNVIYLFVTV